MPGLQSRHNRRSINMGFSPRDTTFSAASLAPGHHMKSLLRIAATLLLLALTAGAVFYWNPLWVNDQQIRHHLWRANVRSEYLLVDGYRIHYYESLPPNGSPGIPLILIHGLASRGEDWAPMIPNLTAAGFHVYVPDLLGHGRSAKPDVAYSVSLEEGVVVDFMHAVGLPHADVDGWSMGGWIAAKIALDHPDMVDRLVLDDSAGLTFQPSFERTAFVPTDAAGLARLQALLTPHPTALPPFVMHASLRKIASNRKIVQQSMDSMESGADLLDSRLASITQPTLIVWGAEDRLIPLSVGQHMHQLIPSSALQLVPKCGHLAPNECSGEVWAGTVMFLKANPPIRGGEFTMNARVSAGTVIPAPAQ
jgi:pimeloyl-ACP methyl ester carboxylesterase